MAHGTPLKESSVDFQNQPIDNVNPVTANIPLTFPTVREVKAMPQTDEPGLRAKVSFMTTIKTRDEELLVRSVHPALRDCEHVSVVEDGQVGAPLWLVRASEAKCIKDSHAAGREVHVLPDHSVPPLKYRSIPASYTNVETINPRSFLRPEEIRSIRQAFPGSTGAQVLLTGWLLIMFAERKAMEACWGKGIPDEIGGLRVGFTLASFQGTAEAIESKPDTFTQQAAIGLRLRLPGGLEAITTVSHAFVRLADPRMSDRRKRFMEHILRAKDYLKKMRPQPSQAPTAGIVRSNLLEDSPLGKKVWLGGTNTCIGRITVTYDRCNRHHLTPYPHGFQHDLSLITGHNLPHLTNPPNTPRVAGWGQYGEALRGQPVFVTRYNVGTSSWFTYQGYDMMRLAQNSIIHGTQYSWEGKTRHPSTALLWRTMRDTDTVERVSGSVLCLGQIHEETAQALLFQNFEGPLMATDHVQISPDEDYPSFKGGFLLPQEVRNSQIITAPHT